MYFSNYLILAVFLHAVSAGIVFKNTVCEGESMEITCPRNYGIDILIGVYGKRNKESCNNLGDEMGDCTLGKLGLEKIKTKCNQKQQCRLHATNDEFNNTCFGARKELRVVHRCLKNFQILTTIVCEFKKIVLECPSEQILKIVYALYGRTNQLKCHDQRKSQSTNLCSHKDAMEIMQKRCEGANKCSLSVSDEVFGKSICSQTSKYLEVDYLCVSEKPVEKLPVLACQNDSIEINKCLRGYSINILTAFYGKKDQKYCFGVPGYEMFGECAGLPTAWDILQFQCQRKRSCVIDVKKLFPSLCPNVYKYLEFSYECVRINTNTSVACENSILQLTCPDGHYLWIVYVFFGRRNQIICQREGGQFSNECHSRTAFDIVAARCNNLKSCIVESKIELFGNPCPEVPKYLEVDYQCLSRTELFLLIPNTCYNGRKTPNEIYDKFLWNVVKTKALIDMYKYYRPKVGSKELPNFEYMWQVIGSELSDQFGINVPSANCEQRWCELEKNYKIFEEKKNSQDCDSEFYFDYWETMDNFFNEEVFNTSIAVYMPENKDCCKRRKGFVGTENVCRTNKETVEQVKKRKLLVQVNKSKLAHQKEKMEIRKEKMQLYRERNDLIKAYIDFMKGSGCCTSCNGGETDGTCSSGNCNRGESNNWVSAYHIND